MVRPTLVRTIVAAGVLAALGGARAANSPKATEPNRGVLRAGAAAVDITPTQFPVHMPGLARENLADGVHDPLHARALVLDDGATTLAIAVVDNIGVRQISGKQDQGYRDQTLRHRAG